MLPSKIMEEVIQTISEFSIDECSEDAGSGFTWADYLVFVTALLISVAIGTFYGCCGSKQTTSSEYLMANRQVSYVPMALSLTTGFLSAISLLGHPSEMYFYGSLYWVSGFSFFLVVPITSYLFLPVFDSLHITSAYQYLHLRFNKTISSFISFMFIIQTLLYSSCMVYAPAIALKLVSGISVYTTVVVVYIVCIFYTSVGGLKAVIWTDTYQTILLVVSILVVMIKGSMEADSILDPSLETGRIEVFNMDPDITIRHTFWSVFVGGTIFWTAMYTSNQSSVQRQLAVPSLTDARKGLWLTAVLLAIIYTMLCYVGMLIYSQYRHCDPLSAGVFPLYVIDVMNDLPGLAGLFVAGIFSASLSSVAASLNSLAAVVVKDFIRMFRETKLTEFQEATVSKVVCIGFGLLSFGIVFFIEQLGGVLQMALTFLGIVSGVVMGVFFLGMYLPWTNWKGALCGTIAGFCFTFWLGFGTQLAIMDGQIVYPRKPMSVDGCKCNETLFIPTATSEPFPLYKVSYLWYSPLGALITVVVGFLASLMTGPQDPELLEANLVADFTKWIANSLPPSWRRRLRLPLYSKQTENTSGSPNGMAQSTETIATIDLPCGTPLP
ncbi:hypothetical protein J437_LFUL016939 [Ladona fulva]|uniref:Sodium-coupled monocarboxylate transporter 1 n=1 Tax=Ladona fulva TaxID=123851 RepID=A0A8K0PAD5_LADFU|nr:hypothetical protein J437_LFUL016939 [Ladona fulva]